MTGLAWSVGGFVITLLLVWVTLKLVSVAGWLVEPNQRSSHVQATPTAGGLGLVLVVLAYLVAMFSAGVTLAGSWAFALVGLAMVGLWDDLAELRARWRWPVQVFASLLTLWALMPTYEAAFSDWGAWLWLWFGLCLIALVWFINLFNFMDGIDGIAGVQAFTFALGTQIVSGGLVGWSGDLVWLLAGASLGFLCFNWPPAKIFMGDVGSQALGLLIGGLVLLLHVKGSVSIPASLILLSVFWADATYTLTVRYWSGQKVTQAHRSHLYQRLAQKYGHFYVTVGFVGLWMVWLLPLAWYASHLSLDGSIWSPWILVAVAITPLVILCQRFAAGRVINDIRDVT
ncbi:MAG: glycosyl transferase [Pseudomonadota bacterium]